MDVYRRRRRRFAPQKGQGRLPDWGARDRIDYADRLARAPKSKQRDFLDNRRRPRPEGSSWSLQGPALFPPGASVPATRSPDLQGTASHGGDMSDLNVEAGVAGSRSALQRLER